MLKELNLKGFKAWSDTGKLSLAPITAFFGPNSSGKTSLLQFLLMLKQTAASSDRSQVLDLGGDRSFVKLGTFDDLLFRKGNWSGGPGTPVNELRWNISWETDEEISIPDPSNPRRTLFRGREVCHEAQLVRLEDGGIKVQEMSYRFGGAKFATHQKADSEKGYDFTVDAENFRPKRVRGRAWDLPPPVKCYGFPDQARGYFQNTGFLSNLELLFEDMFASTYYLGPLREYPAREYSWAGSEPADMGQRGEAVVAALLSARRRGPEISMGQGIPRRTIEQHVAEWLQQLKLVREFRVEEIAPGSNLYRVKVRTGVYSAEVLLTDVGFGISQVLPVLTLAFYVPEGATVILEQPELHLHPGVQAGIADVVIDAMERRDVQIILESHSEHLLLRLQRRIAEGRIKPSDAAIYFCNYQSGNSSIEKLDIDDSGHIKNWPKNFFGDTFADREAIMDASLSRR